MHYLLILNDPPYGSERSYNGLRLATALAKLEGTTVSVFLIGDAAACAVAGQKTPDGYYNLERMLKILKSKRRNRRVRNVHGWPRHQSRNAGRRGGSKHDWTNSPLGPWRPTGYWSSDYRRRNSSAIRRDRLRLRGCI